jgi:hypothetical protein
MIACSLTLAKLESGVVEHIDTSGDRHDTEDDDSANDDMLVGHAWDVSVVKGIKAGFWYHIPLTAREGQTG